MADTVVIFKVPYQTVPGEAEKNREKCYENRSVVFEFPAQNFPCTNKTNVLKFFTATELSKGFWSRTAMSRDEEDSTF